MRASGFREEWELAGRPRDPSWAAATSGSLASAAYAMASLHGLRGDAGARDDWLKIVDALTVVGKPWPERYLGQFFDALPLLHKGAAAQAMKVLDKEPPGQLTFAWHNAMWRPWHAALLAEAAVVSEQPDAARHVAAARLVTEDNPIATAIVDRAAALPHDGERGDRDGLASAAATFDSAGCRYQWARTLVFLGGTDRARGEAELAAIGATAMSWPGVAR